MQYIGKYINNNYINNLANTTRISGSIGQDTVSLATHIAIATKYRRNNIAYILHYTSVRIFW